MKHPATTSRELSTAEIVDRLYAAVLEHRIPPGTKLAETRLADIFAVNRTRIREALAKLAYERIVEIIPHQGAYVFKPSVADTHSVFEARRLLEPFIVGKLATQRNAAAADRLGRHLQREAEARQHEDLPRIIRLSGEFHVLLAELAGNTPLLRATRELTAQTCLAICVYSHSTDQSCRVDEHSTIAEAILQQDARLAGRLVTEHLDHILKSLDLHDVPEEVDLESLFANP